jgi:hypothetical protein
MMTRISRAFWTAAVLSAAVYGAAQAQKVSEEAETNRRGGDYNSFQVRDLRECQRACEREDRCQAYTYYEIETKCFLKDRVPGAEKTRYQTSGVKERRGEGGGGYPGGGGNWGGRLSEERGVDYPGGDYSSFRSEDLDDCQSACRRDRKCEGYTYYPDDDRCYLKERIGGGKRNDNAVSGVKGGGRPSYPGSGGRLSEENGQDYRGGDYDNFRARSLSACQDECRRENRCVAYTYYPKTGVCYVKDRLGDLERNKDSITGRKRR